jgi:hypothetical protein
MRGCGRQMKGRRAAAVVVMRTCKRDFPGADHDTSERLAVEVDADERAIVTALGTLREDASISLEAVGYLMGTNPAQLSRYLKGTTPRHSQTTSAPRITVLHILSSVNRRSRSNVTSGPHRSRQWRSKRRDLIRWRKAQTST